MKYLPSTAVVTAALVGGLAFTVFGAPTRPVPPVGVDADVPGPPESVGLVRVAAKNLVARDAIAGRRSLSEAAALFGRLNDLEPRVVVEAWRLWSAPGGVLRQGEEYTPKDRLRVEVLMWVGGMLRDDGHDREAKVLGDLQCQFSAARRDGDLPEVGAAELAGLLGCARAEVDRMRRQSPSAGPLRTGAPILTPARLLPVPTCVSVE